ncbi:MAG: TSCPD domain-containing protein, partial [Muribaculaceae bacterium]|nr:TSCPD domain-containing protein [Muribaculaceae bacterium]
MKYQYTTKVTCSKLIEFEVEEGVIKNVNFLGGCH